MSDVKTQVCFFQFFFSPLQSLQISSENVCVFASTSFIHLLAEILLLFCLLLLDEMRPREDDFCVSIFFVSVFFAALGDEDEDDFVGDEI